MTGGMTESTDFTHRLVDYMETSGENKLQCTCGQRIYPDCDVSGVSIAKEFDAHLRKVRRG